MADMIWLRGETACFLDVAIVSEGALEVVFDRHGKRVTVPSSSVRALRHGDTPGEFDHALERMEKGDFAAAERLFQALESRKEWWLPAHAAFHRANARRLRAELEGTGHGDGLALLGALREKHSGHFLAPLAALVTGDAALAAKNYTVARAEFRRVATFGAHNALVSRLGLARTDLAAGEDPDAAFAELIKIENDALAAANMDVLLLARITRAANNGKRGLAKAGLELLLPLVDTPGLVRSSWHGAVLNTIAELIVDLAGRESDGSAKPEARAAGAYYLNRAIRYAQDQPVERARTLALAVDANTLSGRNDIALMAKTELQRRFPTSTFAKKWK